MTEEAVETEEVAEEEKEEINFRNKNQVTRNYKQCYNRKERSTGKCRKAA